MTRAARRHLIARVADRTNWVFRFVGNSYDAWGIWMPLYRAVLEGRR